MTTTEIDDFLAGSLVTWFVSCLDEPNAVSTYDDLVDGLLLHKVFLKINPEPVHDGVIPSHGDIATRMKNLEIIVTNMKQFYEERLGHLLIKLPDPTNLGMNPELNIQDMELLLLLLLGCAVECPNKENFITGMKTLPIDTQRAMVNHIKRVTDNHDIVITQDSMENENMPNVFKEIIKRVINERDMYREKWLVSAMNDSSYPDGFPTGHNDTITKFQTLDSISKSKQEGYHHFALELADWKSKVRELRQELEEKTEALLECKEESEHTGQSLVKLKKENEELKHAARTAKSYRDELDAAMEKAERADRLESEVARYRDKLTDIETYQKRIEELRENNEVLMENCEMFEEQLCLSKRKADKVVELEAQIIEYKQIIDDMTMERDADKEKCRELFEENSMLHKSKKAADDAVARAALIYHSEDPVTCDNKLSEQLTNNAQTRALKLELENHRLTALVDSLKENSILESSGRLLDLSELEREGEIRSSELEMKNQFKSLKEDRYILEKDKTFEEDSEGLNNLKGEHSKLMDDFRNLYNATEKLTAEYRNLQEDYTKNEVEKRLLCLKLVELQGEMSIKDERCFSLELQISKLNQRCEMFLHMNSGLDNNRRSLMDHLSVLLNQYQQLLSQSLEDKEHYHMEEKLYRDQVNHLSRQKEKLEEKIMEYYKNKQSCSTKKKRFGASLVKRVRKAGSDLLYKNRQPWTEESKQSDLKIYESESGGNDSDMSEEDRREAAGTPVFDNDSNSLGIRRIRRTSEYMDSSLPTTPLPSPNNDVQSNRSTQHAESRSVLIQNKISTMMNELQSLTISVAEQPPNEEIGERLTSRDTKISNPVWFEYGCA